MPTHSPMETTAATRSPIRRRRRTRMAFPQRRSHYDFGGVTRKQTPQPNTTQNLPGPVQTFTYDSIGRIQKVSNLFNGAYTRYVYSNSQNRVDTFATIIDGASEQNGNEARSFRYLRRAWSCDSRCVSHPGSVGGFGGQLILYDAMGRAISNRTLPKRAPVERHHSGRLPVMTPLPTEDWAGSTRSRPTIGKAGHL